MVLELCPKADACFYLNDFKCFVFQSVAEATMASFRCKYFHKNSRLDVLISSLRKENVSLKKALLKLSHQQSENFKIVEV